MKFLIIAYVSAHFVVSFCVAEEGCHYEETDHKWKVGEYYSPPGKCFELVCLASNQYKAQTCPLSIAIGCTLVPVDYSKEYPLCCETWDCSENNTNSENY